jgi:hypothetical protein
MAPSSLGLAVVTTLASLLIAACEQRGVESASRSESAAAPLANAPAASQQPAFGTPEEAVDALVGAAASNDVTALQRLFGPGTEDLLSSGDDIADRAAREAFVTRYREGHELVAGGPNDIVLLVGEDDWPLPIPLVREAGRWQFDGAAGLEEGLLRRIGANELRAIDVMYGYVAAQEEYASAPRDGAAPGAYAQKLRSDPGTQNGLYWETEPGAPQSPAGPFLANATAEGYAPTASAPVPYHGYVFRTLLAQGPAANGGPREYIVDGAQTGGFAALAYPATYGASGVMTFIVNQDGVVWQRDFGDDTTAAATAITQFDPDDAWTPIAPEE